MQRATDTKVRDGTCGSAGTLSGAEARLRSMLALGRPRDAKEIRGLMERWAY